MKIGAITVGEAPRVDITPDIEGIFGDKVELIQAGGLDGLTREEIAEFAPEEGDYVLVSRLNDGSSVTFAERFVLPRMQAAIDRMEEEGCKLIMMFCTGVFPATLASKTVPMIYPCDILNRIVPMMTKKSSIISIMPSPLQAEQMKQKWSSHVDRVYPIAANPYGDWESLERAAEEAAKIEDADLIVMDCIGYSQKMKDMFVAKTGKPVVLPRTLLARVVSEITDVN